jgi:hypothetical protein
MNIRSKGTHTWDIHVHYYQCPKCGCVIENREDYQYRLGKYEKDLECSKCCHKFTVQKRTKPSFGPIFG